jgi:hypothetical protein
VLPSLGEFAPAFFKLMFEIGTRLRLHSITSRRGRVASAGT